MRIPILSAVLLASRYASTHAQNDNEDHLRTITSSAFLSCSTGDAQTYVHALHPIYIQASLIVCRRYEFCSSSISSKIDECKEDLGCACKFANQGFDCLTSYCPTHTQAVCEASLALSNICALVSCTLVHSLDPTSKPANPTPQQVQQPGPTVKDLTCPSTVTNLLASLIPSNLPLNLASYLPSAINGIPSGIPVWNGPQQTVDASQTAGAAGGKELGVVLGLAVLGSVVLGGLAA